jgi:hypothetical protein
VFGTGSFFDASRIGAKRFGDGILAGPGEHFRFKGPRVASLAAPCILFQNSGLPALFLRGNYRPRTFALYRPMIHAIYSD